MSGARTNNDNSKVSERGNMGDRVPPAAGGSHHGHTGTVDKNLARRHGGRPSTWHSRRFGPQAVNQLAAAIIREWRESGDPGELAAWVRPIEDAMGSVLAGADASPRLRAALADAAEDDAEARYHENPCEETARALLRRRAADRLASLEHDRHIAEKHGLTL